MSLPSPEGSTQSRLLIKRLPCRPHLKASRRKEEAMQVVYERCCGMDVHKKTVSACAITPQGRETRTYGTFTDELLQALDWLRGLGVTHVAMESTGSYWKPIYNLLEAGGFEVLLVNARHIKQVPGRKTDIRDAEWIADLLRHGLLAASFVPDRDQRELRELIRYRRSLIEERSRELNRMEKVLQGANIKLSSVVSDISGVSSRSMIEAIISGIEEPWVLAALARGKLKRKADQLEQALCGLVGPHQQMMLSVQLKHLDFLDAQIAELDREIEERMLPFGEEMDLLRSMPGVGKTSSEEIVAEIGVDMDRFPGAGHLASWAGMCPGNHQSAGKRLSGKTTNGNKHLRATLVQCAHAAARSKNTYYHAQYGRIAARRGAKRAAVAVANSMLQSMYHMLKNKEPYRELGATYFDELKREANISRAVGKLESLGYKVMLEDAAA